MSGSVEVAVVLPIYNRSESVVALIASLGEQTLEPHRYEVVIVDDCSTDGTWEVLNEVASGANVHVRVLRMPHNSGGPAAPRNLGWRSTDAPVIAFIDDDCLPHSKWLENGLEAMNADSALGLVQGRTTFPEGYDSSNLPRWAVARLVHDPSPWFEATNILYRRTALEEVGGFDEEIKWWGEDTDLGWRVRGAGWKTGFSDGALVYHEVELRGWKWWVKFGWLDHRIIPVAARHPELRREGFFLPWVFHRHDLAYVSALTGLALARRWPTSLMLTLPYAWMRRPPFRRDGINRTTLAIGLQTVLVDTVRVAGHLRGSLSAGILVI